MHRCGVGTLELYAGPEISGVKEERGEPLTTCRHPLECLTGSVELFIEKAPKITSSSSLLPAEVLMARSLPYAFVFLAVQTFGSQYHSEAGGDMKMNQTVMLVAIAVGTVTSMTRGAAQAPPSPDQLVAALKQNLAESQKRLRQYEWIETTAISLKGEEKSRKQQRVYYGADGKLTKVPMGEPAAAAEPSGGGGGRGRRGGGRVKENIVENKKDEMVEYMGKASALIQKYVPPDPAQVQKAKDAKNLAVAPQPDGKVRLAFKDYVQPKDMMNIDVDAKAALFVGDQCGDVSGETRGYGDTRRPVRHACRRHELHGSDYARGQGQEHPCRRRERRSPSAGEMTQQPG